MVTAFITFLLLRFLEYGIVLKRFLPVDDPILLIKMSRHPLEINIIQVYAPTTKSSEDFEAFYGDIELVKAHTKNICLDDWNVVD